VTSLGVQLWMCNLDGPLVWERGQMTVSIKLALGFGTAAVAWTVAIAEAQPHVTIPVPSAQMMLALILLAQTALQVWDRKQRRDYEKESRLRRAETKKDLEATAQLLASSAADIKAGLIENTNLTKEGVHKAEMAYEVSNNLNEKIAAVGDVRRASSEKLRRATDSPKDNH